MLATACSLAYTYSPLLIVGYKYYVLCDEGFRLANHAISAGKLVASAATKIGEATWTTGGWIYAKVNGYWVPTNSPQLRICDE